MGGEAGLASALPAAVIALADGDRGVEALDDAGERPSLDGSVSIVVPGRRF